MNKAITSCATLQCNNGGTCSTNTGTAVCTCLIGFTGTRCETGKYTQKKLKSSLFVFLNLNFKIERLLSVLIKRNISGHIG